MSLSLYICIYIAIIPKPDDLTRRRAKTPYSFGNNSSRGSGRRGSRRGSSWSSVAPRGPPWLLVVNRALTAEDFVQSVAEAFN